MDRRQIPLRTASTTAGEVGVSRLRALAGIALAAGALLVALLVVRRLPGPADESYDPSTQLLLIVVSGASAYATLVALGPVLVRPLLAAVGWPLRRLGPLGRLAVGGVGAAPRRAAAVGVVVALGVTVMAGALVVTASLGTMLRGELASAAPADFEVLGAEGGADELPAGSAQRIRAVEGLTRVVPYRTDARLSVPGTDLRELVATDLDLRALGTWPDFVAADGSFEDVGPGRVVMFRSFAE
ncbi:hypothetical protein [Micromonospora deserti]|uniref:hypothetical protein n=1 Tax=Micromonospora deserti TaxID=2070366 RepID=UPI00131494AC|nr:hypothetical protein [Micromonospora deserti]